MTSAKWRKLHLKIFDKITEEHEKTLQQKLDIIEKRFKYPFKAETLRKRAAFKQVSPTHTIHTLRR